LPFMRSHRCSRTGVAIASILLASCGARTPLDVDASSLDVVDALSLDVQADQQPTDGAPPVSCPVGSTSTCCPTGCCLNAGAVGCVGGPPCLGELFCLGGDSCRGGPFPGSDCCLTEPAADLKLGCPIEVSIQARAYCSIYSCAHRLCTRDSDCDGKGCEAAVISGTTFTLGVCAD
jgi:hypothetical protein